MSALNININMQTYRMYSYLQLYVDTLQVYFMTGQAITRPLFWPQGRALLPLQYFLPSHDCCLERDLILPYKKP